MMRSAAVVLLLSLFAAPALAANKDKGNLVATDPAQVDEDFAFQGEYLGLTNTPTLGCEYAGLQVCALGDGQFSAVQYRGGLPGAGWNRQEKFKLEGQRKGGKLTLAAGSFTIVIECGTAVLRNSAGQQVGRLCRIHRVSPTLCAAPPCGATVLFDGSTTKHFDNGKINEAGCLMAGAMTKQPVGDFCMHLEFRTPYRPHAKGQARGNSGVYVQRRYEVQILDSFSLEGETNECGGLYRTKTPDVNMCLPPLSWQTYDVDFRAARFDKSGKKIANARITVFHNGEVIHDDFELPNKTGAGRQEGPDPLPIWLQDHGNPVQFRNIWIVEK